MRQNTDLLSEHCSQFVGFADGLDLIADSRSAPASVRKAFGSDVLSCRHTCLTKVAKSVACKSGSDLPMRTLPRHRGQQPRKGSRRSPQELAYCAKMSDERFVKRHGKAENCGSWQELVQGWLQQRLRKVLHFLHHLFCLSTQSPTPSRPSLSKDNLGLGEIVGLLRLLLNILGVGFLGCGVLAKAGNWIAGPFPSHRVSLRQCNCRKVGRHLACSLRNQVQLKTAFCKLCWGLCL